MPKYTVLVILEGETGDGDVVRTLLVPTNIIDDNFKRVVADLYGYGSQKVQYFDQPDICDTLEAVEAIFNDMNPPQDIVVVELDRPDVSARQAALNVKEALIEAGDPLSEVFERTNQFVVIRALNTIILDASEDTANALGGVNFQCTVYNFNEIAANGINVRAPNAGDLEITIPEMEH
jgi:hypothetical protein